MKKVWKIASTVVVWLVVLVAAFALRAAYIWIMELTGWGLLEYLGQFLVR